LSGFQFLPGQKRVGQLSDFRNSRATLQKNGNSVKYTGAVRFGICGFAKPHFKTAIVGES
jgi:hypothetical protein